jgi:hypothetical protein
MKGLTMNTLPILLGAGMADGTLSAKTIKADVPFPFRAGKQVMQPGEYHVSLLTSLTGSRVVKVTNSDINRTVLLAPVSRDTSQEWSAGASPKLRFACSEWPCSLTGLWTSEGVFLFCSDGAQNGDPTIVEITLQ